jgi:hypothetical protein
MCPMGEGRPTFLDGKAAEFALAAVVQREFAAEVEFLDWTIYRCGH